MIRLRPLAAGVVGWAAGAASGVAVGLLALSLVGEGLTDAASPPALDSYAVAVPISPQSQPAAGPTPEISASATPTATPVERQFTTDGGYVVAQCRAGGAYLVYWSPAQGYRADDVRRGPAETARLEFKGEGQEIKVKVSCRGGVPQSRVETEDDEDEEHH